MNCLLNAPVLKDPFWDPADMSHAYFTCSPLGSGRIAAEPGVTIPRWDKPEIAKR
jgi:hypothetical protein